MNKVLSLLAVIILSTRSADRWIEADPWLWPTEQGIQRTAGVKASLRHNQELKKKKKRPKKNRPRVREAACSSNNKTSE